MQYLRDEISRIDENWAAQRFDSLPHVVHILTSKDREGDILFLKEQSDVVEEVVDEVVHAYHSGFNKAIQNYSQVSWFFFSIVGWDWLYESKKKKKEVNSDILCLSFVRMLFQISSIDDDKKMVSFGPLLRTSR